MDQLEERGVIGPSGDGKSREVVNREAVTIDKRPTLDSDREYRGMPEVYAG